jgi:hypothetical protein
MMNGSVQSTIHLQGRLLGLDHGQGTAGDTVPMVATLMTRNGTLPGALVLAAVENEGGTDYLWLLDDGLHHDGASNDGIYGGLYSQTSHGGSYGVRIAALFYDPADPATLLLREWNGGFWIKGPQEEGEDLDDDGLPDEWERRCDLDTRRDDSQDDPDRDGLVNIEELELGTLPCQADTDNGGELDGSEVKGSRNPLWPDDDQVGPVGHLEIRPLDQAIWVSWSRPYTATMVGYVSPTPGELGESWDMGNTGSFTFTKVTNDRPYYLTFQRYYRSAEAWGAFSDQYEVTPKADPVPPQGAFLIGGPNVVDGGDSAISRNVTLYIDATDQLAYEGPASHSVGHYAVRPEMGGHVEVSGDVHMRFSNDLSTIGSVEWEPLAETKPWTLDCADGETCIVYGQFRDRADNESLIVDRQVILVLCQGEDCAVYLPIILKNH